MGSKRNPGEFDCYAAAAPDEGMFILLARDRLGPLLVRIWALLRFITRVAWPALVHSSIEHAQMRKVREAFACARKMKTYRDLGAPNGG